MATSKAQWIKNRTHDITLPSGTEVQIELPNLGEMIKGGELSNKLVQIATKKINREDINVDLISQLADFNRFLVAKTVVNPKVEETDVPSLPPEDIDLIVALANRERDVDAVGHQLAGLESDAAFRKFRRFDSSDEDLQSL